MIIDSVDSIARARISELLKSAAGGYKIYGSASFFNESVCIKNISSCVDVPLALDEGKVFEEAFLSKLLDWCRFASHVTLSVATNRPAVAFSLASVISAKRFSHLLNLQLGSKTYYYCPVAHDTAALAKAFPRRPNRSGDLVRSVLRLSKDEPAELTMLPAQMYLLRPQAYSVRITELSGYQARRLVRTGGLAAIRQKTILEGRLEKYLAARHAEGRISGRINCKTGRYDPSHCRTSELLLRGLTSWLGAEGAHFVPAATLQLSLRSLDPAKLDRGSAITLYRRDRRLVSRDAEAGNSCPSRWAELASLRFPTLTDLSEIADELNFCLHQDCLQRSSDADLERLIEVSLAALECRLVDPALDILIRKTSVAIDLLHCVVAVSCLARRVEDMSKQVSHGMKNWLRRALASLFDCQINSAVSEFYVHNFASMKGGIVMSSIDPTIDILELTRCRLLLTAIPLELLNGAA